MEARPTARDHRLATEGSGQGSSPRNLGPLKGICKAFYIGFRVWGSKIRVPFRVQGIGV